jgi:pantoate--beta-alanine ligase
VKVLSDPRQFQSISAERYRKGRRLGLVPTMGALHEAHLALVDEAQRHADWVALSIFVNPTQFGPNEDFDRYPRTLERDLDLCRERGVDLVFAPEAGAMYVPGDATRVSVTALEQQLCGASRPGHFTGVCTVVSKLFQLAGPSTAVFGRKDYQQWKIIERMVRDLFMPVNVHSLATVREPDGLALSSRNLRLSPSGRVAALALVRGLARAQRAFDQGARSAEGLRALAREQIQAAGLRVDYVSLADPDLLTPLGADVPSRALLAVAAYVDDVRLIDNVVLGEDRALGEAS